MRHFKTAQFTGTNDYLFMVPQALKKLYVVSKHLPQPTLAEVMLTTNERRIPG